MISTVKLGGFISDTNLLVYSSGDIINVYDIVYKTVDSFQLGKITKSITMIGKSFIVCYEDDPYEIFIYEDRKLACKFTSTLKANYATVCKPHNFYIVANENTIYSYSIGNNDLIVQKCVVSHPDVYIVLVQLTKNGRFCIVSLSDGATHNYFIKDYKYNIIEKYANLSYYNVYNNMVEANEYTLFIDNKYKLIIYRGVGDLPRLLPFIKDSYGNIMTPFCMKYDIIKKYIYLGFKNAIYKYSIDTGLMSLVHVSNQDEPNITYIPEKIILRRQKTIDVSVDEVILVIVFENNKLNIIDVSRE
jgi:hypothetical protein